MKVNAVGKGELVDTTLDGGKARVTFWLVAALVIADVTAAFETAMIFLSLPSIVAEYGRPVTVGWLITGYMLMAAAVAAICARLGDLYGRRRVLLVVLAIAGVGSLISALAPALEFVLLGRILQGFSGAVMPLCFGVIRESVPTSRIPVSITIVATASTLGAALGDVVAGLLIDNLGWRYVFVASAVFAVFSWLAVVSLVPKVKGAWDGRPLDFVGGLLFAPAIAACLLAISYGRSWNWDGRAWGLLGLGEAVLAVWVWHERRCTDPLIDVRLFARRRIALANLALGLVGFSGLVMAQLSVTLLQQPSWTGVGLGLTATLAAAIRLPGNLTTTAAGPLIGIYCRKWGPSRIVMLGGILAAVSFFSLNLYHDSLWANGIVVVTGSLGVMMIVSASQVILVREAPSTRTAEITGIAAVTRIVAFAIGTQSMSVILASDTVQRAGTVAVYPTLGAFHIQFTVMAAGCLLAGVMGWLCRSGGETDDAEGTGVLIRSAAADG